MRYRGQLDRQGLAAAFHMCEADFEEDVRCRLRGAPWPPLPAGQTTRRQLRLLLEAVIGYTVTRVHREARKRLANGRPLRRTSTYVVGGDLYMATDKVRDKVYVSLARPPRRAREAMGMR